MWDGGLKCSPYLVRISDFDRFFMDGFRDSMCYVINGKIYQMSALTYQVICTKLGFLRIFETIYYLLKMHYWCYFGVEGDIFEKVELNEKYQAQKVVRITVGVRKLFQSCLGGKIDKIHNFEKGNSA